MYRVVIVDDEQIVKLAVKSMIDWNAGEFELAGTAGDGLSALRLVENEKVDIVITDLKMPRMDGIGLIAKLRERENPPEILVLSNHGDFENVRHALKLGAYDYMLKTTIDPESLMKSMRELALKLDERRKNEREAAGLPDDHGAMPGAGSDPFGAPGRGSGMDQSGGGAPALGQNIRYPEAGKGLVLEVQGDSDKLFEAVADELRAERGRSAGLLYVMPGVTPGVMPDVTPSVVPEPAPGVVPGAVPGSAAAVGRETATAGAEQDSDNSLRMLGNLAEQGFKSGPRCLIQKHSSGAIVLVQIVAEGKNFPTETAARWLADQARLYYVVELGVVFSPLVADLAGLKNILSDCVRVAELFFYNAYSSSVMASFDTSDLSSEFKLQGSNPPPSPVPDRGPVSTAMVHEHLAKFVQWCSGKRVSPRFLKRQLSRWVEKVLPRAEAELPGAEAIQNAPTENALYYLFGYRNGSGSRKDSDSRDSYRAEVRKIIEYIEEHATERISVAFLAQMVRMSETYLCTVFKSQTSKSIVNYINDSKLDRAKDLLVTGRYLIKEVAAEVGIEDPFYFNRLFKRRFGVSPSEMLP